MGAWVRNLNTENPGRAKSRDNVGLVMLGWFKLS